MEFQEDFTEGNQIRGYGAEGIRVNETVYTQSLIVTAEVIETCPNYQQLSDLELIHPQILTHRPEVVIIGTGQQTEFPAAQSLKFFIDNRIAYEFMTTDAACRTYNVLLAEGRQVMAVLMR